MHISEMRDVAEIRTFGLKRDSLFPGEMLTPPSGLADRRLIEFQQPGQFHRCYPQLVSRPVAEEAACLGSWSRFSSSVDVPSVNSKARGREGDVAASPLPQQIYDVIATGLYGISPW